MPVPDFCFNLSKYGLLLLVLPVLSCSNYFKPVAATTPSAAAKRDIIMDNAASKYFILRMGEKNYAINNIAVDAEASLLTGNLSALGESHLNYINSGETGNYTYKVDNRKSRSVEVLNEVHIYTNNNDLPDISKPYSLPLDKITKIEIIRQDEKRTRSSHTWAGLGVGVGVFITALVVFGSVSIRL